MTWTSLQAELYATVHAVWNDLLIDRATLNDAAIIAGEKNWSEEKREKYTEKEIGTAIEYLRNEQLIPKGTGRKTRPASARRKKTL